MSEKYNLLSEIKEEVSSCRKCRLCETRQNTVFGEGNPDSRFLIIGEGPGATEDLTGSPFVGRAGKLLTDCLEICGISRNHVFIANILKCRACIIDGKINKNRPPARDEIESCTPWLKRQIEIINPLVILTLGAPASSSMLGYKIAMTKERGKLFETAFGPVIPALHPSYILRNMYRDGDGGKSLLISDIELAKSFILEQGGNMQDTPIPMVSGVKANNELNTLEF